MFQRVAYGEPALQVAIGVGGVWRREIENGHAQHRAHSDLQKRACAGVGKEVHVVAAGHAAAQHFRCREPDAVVDELRTDELALPWPDMLLQPDSERHVVGDSAKQAHRRMRVRVYQTWQEHVVRQYRALACFVPIVGQRGRYERDDPSGVDNQRMVPKRAGGLDRYDPAGVEAEVYGLHPASVARNGLTRIGLPSRQK